jgi:hypothetical protein
MPMDTFYLPKEAVNFINFPELRTYKADIETIMEYALRVQTAVADYNEARYDRIDLNMEELHAHIDLCRTVCEALGSAPNVCFDILLEIRNIQQNLQNLAYLKTKFGSAIIGEPTTTTSEEGSVV